MLQAWEWRAVCGGTITDLTTVLQRGLLPALPTFSAWAQGTSFANRSGSAQSMQLASQNFHSFGWPYPSAAPGACS